MLFLFFLAAAQFHLQPGAQQNVIGCAVALWQKKFPSPSFSDSPFFFFPPPSSSSAKTHFTGMSTLTVSGTLSSCTGMQLICGCTCSQLKRNITDSHGTWRKGLGLVVQYNCHLDFLCLLLQTPLFGTMPIPTIGHNPLRDLPFLSGQEKKGDGDTLSKSVELSCFI